MSTSDMRLAEGTCPANGTEIITLPAPSASRSDVLELEMEGATSGVVQVLGLGQGNTYKPLGSIDFAGTDATWLRIDCHSVREIKLDTTAANLNTDASYWLTGKDE